MRINLDRHRRVMGFASFLLSIISANSVVNTWASLPSHIRCSLHRLRKSFALKTLVPRHAFLEESHALINP